MLNRSMCGVVVGTWLMGCTPTGTGVDPPGGTDAGNGGSSSGQTSSSAPGSADAGGGDAGHADGGTGDGGWNCAGSLELSTQALKTESVARLRAFFGETAGLDDGEMYYRDGVTSVNACPIYDQSAVLYSVVVPPRLVPPELVDLLEGMRPRVHYVWGLNGYGKIHYAEDRGLVPGFDGQAWGYDRSPLDACRILKADVTPARAQEVQLELQALTTMLTVSLLAEIGIVCWGPELDTPLSSELTGAEHLAWMEANAVAARVRVLTEFEPAYPMEWSPIVYGFEMFLTDPVPITTPTVTPQCLRTLSANYLNDPLLQIFASLPSFPRPYGQGWLNNPETARCP